MRAFAARSNRPEAGAAGESAPVSDNGTVLAYDTRAAGRWRSVSSSLNATPVFSLAVSPDGRRTVLAGTVGALYRGGRDGERMALAGEASITSIAWSPMDSRHALASVFGVQPPVLATRWRGNLQEPQKVESKLGGSTFPAIGTIASHPLRAPEKPPGQAMVIGTATWYVLRLTLTYRDIFDRKHVAIFDYKSGVGWETVAIRSGIAKDLHALQEAANAAALARSGSTKPQSVP